MKLSKSILIIYIAAVLAVPVRVHGTNGMILEGYGPVATGMGGASFANYNGLFAMMNNPATLSLIKAGTFHLDLGLGFLGPKVSSSFSGVPTAESGGTAYWMPKFELSMYSSLWNSYAMGNLRPWFSEFAENIGGGNPGANVRGARGFSLIQGMLYFQPTKGAPKKKASSPLLGVGLSYYKAIEHAIWGVDLVFGGRSEVVLNPTILTVVLAIKIPVKAVKAAFLVIEPGANIGWVDGYVKWNDQPSGDAQRVDLDTPGPGFGGQLAIGADWYFTKNLGVNVRGGYRYLKVEFNHYDSNGDPYFSIDGENVEPDLSGMYGVAGVSLRF